MLKKISVETGNLTMILKNSTRNRMDKNEDEILRQSDSQMFVSIDRLWNTKWKSNYFLIEINKMGKPI